MSATSTLSLECVGMGSFGKIFATDDPNIVCKIFKDKNCISFPTEYATMLLLHDVPDILKIHHVDFEGRILYSQRYKTNLNVYNIRQKISMEDIRKVIYKILVALHHTHSRGLMHRDIKSDNIFVNYERSEDGTTKITDVVIGDWGSVYPLGKTENTFSYEIQTICYRAPEVMACNNNYTSKIDVWSVGCILVELLYYRRFISPSTRDDITGLIQIFRVCGTPERFRQYFPNFSPNWSRIKTRENPQDEHGMDLLKHLLDLDPITRYSCFEALKHPFFDSVRQDDVPKMAPENIKISSLPEIDEINGLVDLHNYSDRTRQLAHYYYQICHEEMKNDDINLAYYTVSLAAAITDYRFRSCKESLFTKMFHLVKHDLYGLQHFGVPVESFGELIPLRMLAYTGKLTESINKIQMTNMSYKYTDDTYDYCVVTIESYGAHYLRKYLLTVEQLRQLNSRMAVSMEGWTHFATFENRHKYLLFRNRKV